jgi:hypothetical protein
VRRGIRWLVFLLLAGSACRRIEYFDAMLVAVEVEAGSSIQCVRFSAQSLETNRIREVDVVLGERWRVSVGVPGNADFTGEVRVTLTAFLSKDCSGMAVATLTRVLPLTQPPYEPTVFRFSEPDGGLVGPDAGRPDAGASDAGPADAGPADAGAPDAGSCDLATCAMTECVRAQCTTTGCVRPPSAFRSPCDGGLCDGQGRCVVNPCFAGDGCDAGLSCARDGRCSDAGMCVATYSECTSGNPCLIPMQACAADGGCAFTAQPLGTSCGVDAVCYPNAECRPSLRAANVEPFRVPYPNTPMEFLDAGCVYGFDTSGNGTPLPGGTFDINCTWPRMQAPVVVPQGAAGVDVLAFAGTGLSIAPGVFIRIVGQRPAVFLIHGDATIRGEISLRAVTSQLRGAGADTPACGRGGVGQMTPREGGGGGGFLDLGGHGAGGTMPGMNGGAANGTPDLVPLRGGCSGGFGWLGVDGGFGAGALQVSASGAFSLLDGGLGAGGLGGAGGLLEGGGGGGGSGGAFLLQASTITVINSTITANGGGGGEGGTRVGSGTRTGGNRGLIGSFESDQPAAGGVGGNCCGGVGGAGGAGDTPPTTGRTGSTGSGNTPAGGGGGGSRGRLRLDTPPTGASSCTVVSSLLSPDVAVEGPTTSCPGL